MGVTEADCSLDQSSTDGAKALDIVSAGQELANFDLNTGTLPMLDDIQSLVDEAVGDVDITSDNETVCTGAGGTWDDSVCTPAPVADPDCFRKGACGAEGWDSGSYAGVTLSSSGCLDPPLGIGRVLFALGNGLLDILRREAIPEYDLKHHVCLDVG